MTSWSVLPLQHQYPKRISRRAKEILKRDQHQSNSMTLLPTTPMLLIGTALTTQPTLRIGQRRRRRSMSCSSHRLHSSRTSSSFPFHKAHSPNTSRPLASSIFAPSIDQVMREFHSTNEQLASFIVSVYLLGYCFGPLVIAPLSEMYGRLPLYHICNVLFVAFTVACAKAPNLGGLIAFRLLAGLAGSCPLTIGAGSLADMISKEKRGAAMSSWALGPLFGPVIGPIGK